MNESIFVILNINPFEIGIDNDIINDILKSICQY